MMVHVTARLVVLLFPKYSQTRLIRTLLIRHFRLICWENLETLKALSLTLMLNYPLNLSPRLVHHKISACFSDELSGSNCITNCACGHAYAYLLLYLLIPRYRNCAYTCKRTQESSRLCVQCAVTLTLPNLI